MTSRFGFALLAMLAVPATSLVLQTTELKSFGASTSASTLHPDATAKLLATIQDTWKNVARSKTEEHLQSFDKSCKTVTSAIISGSDGDHDRVQTYMDEVCQQSFLDTWHKGACQQFQNAVGKSMTFNNYANRASFNYDAFCISFFNVFAVQETAAFEKEEVVRLAAEKVALEKEVADNKEKAKKAEEARKAEEEAAAWKAKKQAEQKAIDDAKAKEAEEQRLAKEAKEAKEAEEKENAKQKKLLMEANARAAALRKGRAAKALKEAQEEAKQAEQKAAEQKAAAEKAAKIEAEAKADIEKAAAEAMKEAKENLQKKEAEAKQLQEVAQEAKAKAEAGRKALESEKKAEEESKAWMATMKAEKADDAAVQKRPVVLKVHSAEDSKAKEADTKAEAEHQKQKDEVKDLLAQAKKGVELAVVKASVKK